MNALDQVNGTLSEGAEPYGYWDNHPALPLADWQYEVANGDTRAGYWEWVAAQMGLREI